MSQSINEPVPNPTTDATKQGIGAGVIFASQTRDATGASGGSASGAYVSQERYNLSAKGLRLYINMSTGASTGTVTLQVQVPDPANPTSWVNVGAASTGVSGPTGPTNGGSFVALTLYPGLTGIADSAPTGSNTNAVLGPRWRVQATVANAPSTFTVGGDYLA